MKMDMNASRGSGPSTGVATDARLRDRFLGLWQRCIIPGASGDGYQPWRTLARYYNEPHRLYHGERHLAHCLEQLDLAIDRVVHPDQVEMAIWFHDVINQPSRPDNEARSAELFRELAAGLMPEAFIAAVVRLILATRHRETPVNPDQQILCDIDLASFGCPWECYLRDTGHLRAEFRGSDEDYCNSKRAFLQALQRRPRIFSTDFFRDRYERLARENIQRLLDLIDAWQRSPAPIQEGDKLPYFRGVAGRG
ncbi:MAG: hypothetical protein EA400_17300 [Chromatiaceae bacterium]|nr:MAG: hypothetical protein EA400_17300 [Chromatiaceae bacterium]